MNRIRELREAAGLSGDELGALCGVAGATITRLERGKIKLTVHYMQLIAKALGVTPAELIATAALAGFSDDVAKIQPAAGYAAALARRGIDVYRVMSDVVSNMGISPGDEITVDGSDPALSELKTGDLVLATLRDVSADERAYLCLRLYVSEAAMLTTARESSNVALSLRDPGVEAKIIGVVSR